MPLYEIKCPRCKIIEEVFTHHTEKDKHICQICGTKMYALISKPNFHIKGYKEANGYEQSGRVEFRGDTE